MAAVSYRVRQMTPEDVPDVLNCYSELEIAECTYNIYTWLEIDPEGLYVAQAEDGQIIGVCCATFHEDANLYFVGMYIVREKYRGKGIGKAVWDACMKHIGPANAALNAVPGKEELYRVRGGFPIVEEGWLMDVYQSKNAVNADGLSDYVPEGVTILPYTESLLESVQEFDLSFVGYRRRKALQLSCKEEGSKTYVAMKNEKCIGFGSIKIGGLGSVQNLGKVGPMYADESFAEALLKKLIESQPHMKGFTMMPISTNAHVKILMDKIGCPYLLSGTRMYRKEKLEVNGRQVYSHWDCNFSPY